MACASQAPPVQLFCARSSGDVKPVEGPKSSESASDCLSATGQLDPPSEEARYSAATSPSSQNQAATACTEPSTQGLAALSKEQAMERLQNAARALVATLQQSAAAGSCSSGAQSEQARVATAALNNLLGGAAQQGLLRMSSMQSSTTQSPEPAKRQVDKRSGAASSLRSSMVHAATGSRSRQVLTTRPSVTGPDFTAVMHHTPMADLSGTPGCMYPGFAGPSSPCSAHTQLQHLATPSSNPPAAALSPSLQYGPGAYRSRLPRPGSFAAFPSTPSSQPQSPRFHMRGIVQAPGGIALPTAVSGVKRMSDAELSDRPVQRYKVVVDVPPESDTQAASSTQGWDVVWDGEPQARAAGQTAAAPQPPAAAAPLSPSQAPQPLPQLVTVASGGASSNLLSTQQTATLDAAAAVCSNPAALPGGPMAQQQAPILLGLPGAVPAGLPGTGLLTNMTPLPGDPLHLPLPHTMPSFPFPFPGAMQLSTGQLLPPLPQLPGLLPMLPMTTDPAAVGLPPLPQPPLPLLPPALNIDPVLATVSKVETRSVQGLSWEPSKALPLAPLGAAAPGLLPPTGGLPPLPQGLSPLPWLPQAPGAGLGPAPPHAWPSPPALQSATEAAALTPPPLHLLAPPALTPPLPSRRASTSAAPLPGGAPPATDLLGGPLSAACTLDKPLPTLDGLESCTFDGGELGQWRRTSEVGDLQSIWDLVESVADDPDWASEPAVV